MWETLGAAVMAGTLAASLLGAGCGSGDMTSTSSKPSETAIAATWKRLSREGVQELRKPPSAPRWPYASLERPTGEMPASMRRVTMRALGDATPLRLRFSRAQFASAPIGVGLWVIPGRGVVCMLADSVLSVSCDTTERVVRRGLHLGTYSFDPDTERRSEFVLVGIAPNWSRKVVTVSGKRTVAVPVIDNAFGRRASASIEIRSLRR